jgi:hypothetical protein
VTIELTSMTEALRGTLSVGDVLAARKLGHHVRSRVPETMMPNNGGGGSSKSMGGDYAGGRSGRQVNRVEGVRAITASKHDTHRKVAYGEPPGIELHRTVIVTSNATNRGHGLVRLGATRTS